MGLDKPPKRINVQAHRRLPFFVVNYHEAAVPRDPQRRKRFGLEHLAVVVSLCALCASVWQGWIARDNEQRSLRPYLSKSRVTFSINPLAAYVVFKNDGATPAYDVRANIHINGPLPFPIPGNDVTVFNIGDPPHAAGNVATIFKDDTIALPVSVPGMFVSPQQIADTPGNQSRVYVWGEITFKDAFAKQHLFHFCYIYGGASMSRDSFVYCKNYNDSDAGP